MKVDVFLQQLADALEMPNVSLKMDTDFRELDDFDSLSVLSIVAFADEKFGVRIPVEKLRTIVAVHDLMEAIGLVHFE